MNTYNKTFLTHVEQNERSIILHSDETDIYTSYILHLINYLSDTKNCDKNVLVCANTDDVLSFIKDGIITHFNKQDFSINNFNKLLFTPNNNSIKFVKPTKTCGVGVEYDLICVLDAAFSNVLDFDFILERNTKLIMSSRPNGYNAFYKLFTMNERKMSTGLATLRMYFWLEQKDTMWVLDRIERIGENEFNKSYNLCFSVDNRI